MSLDLFRVVGGFAIHNEALSSSAFVLQGTGAPGADVGFQDAASLGSLYLRTDSTGVGLQQYVKVTSTNSTSDWVLIADKTYVDNAIIGLSWREPAIARSTVTTVPATLAGVAATFQVTGSTVTRVNHGLVNGEQIQFTDIGTVTGITIAPTSYYVLNVVGNTFQVEATLGGGAVTFGGTDSAGAYTKLGTTVVDNQFIPNNGRVLFNNLTTNPNVYIYNSSTGLFVQDQNLATAGDALFVTAGTSAGDRWTYNGTTWVLFGAASDEAEFGFINTFIGKSARGSITPTYTSQFAITTTASLQTAVSALDTAFGAGTLTHGASTNYALNSNMAFVGTNGANSTLTITAAINGLNEAIGQRVYTTGTNYPITANGHTVAVDLEALNIAIHTINTNTNVIIGSVASTPSTFFTVDTIAVASFDQYRWLVQVRETATPANVRATEIHAVTDGTNIDSTRYAELTLGAGVAGFGAQAIISGTDVVLQLKATANYDYSVKRVALSHF